MYGMTDGKSDGCAQSKFQEIAVRVHRNRNLDRAKEIGAKGIGLTLVSV
jgi:hypothetical protein